MIARCNKGHWYDAGVNRKCPHCKRAGERLGIQLNDVEEDDKTISLVQADESLGAKLQSMQKDIDAAQANAGLTAEDDEKTIAFGFWGVTKISPVVGWLICMNGEERGKDYRLHAGKNFIGRGNSMDVWLVDDKSVARDRRCSVTYDPKGNVFYVSGERGNLVYLNGEALDCSSRLQKDDEIVVGATRLAFVPFCGEGRTWEKE